jgi:putative addiction module component (TIGR02574 family)
MISTAEIQSLSIDERYDLIDHILITIAADRQGPPLTDAQRRDIEARLVAIKGNPDDKCSWDEFRRTLPNHP